MLKSRSTAHRHSLVPGRRRTAAALVSAALALVPGVVGMQSAQAAPVAAVSSTGETVYIVAKGDTLTRISTRFHTTVAALATLNHVKNVDSLAVGQRLNIPAPQVNPAPASGIVTTSYGARLDPHKCAASTSYWKGHRRFFLSNHADDGCFRSPWFSGTHPIMVSYGPTSAPWYPGTNYHHGIDIDMAVGTPVFAGVSGIVHVHPAVLGPAYGTSRMLIRAGHTDYVLGHMSRLVVREGQLVAKGQLIGYSGMSGVEDEDGPHLHFQVEPAGTSYLHAVDPRAALSATRI